MSPGWKVIGASVVGKSHLADGTPCQDAHAFRLLADGTLVAAIGDGAGSAARSHEGSLIAVSTAVETIAARVAQEPPDAQDEPGLVRLFHEALRAARAAVEEHAAVEGESSRQFATTLTCVVANHRMLAGFQVGDGFCVIQEPDGSLTTATRPARGEYANETTFVTEERAAKQLDMFALPTPADAIVLSSDGLLRLALKIPGYTPSEPFFRPLLGFAEQLTEETRDELRPQLEALLASDRVNARTDDDKTLVIAVREGRAAEVAPAEERSDAARDEADDEATATEMDPAPVSDEPAETDAVAESETPEPRSGRFPAS